MFTLMADEDDDEHEITEPREVAELFAAISAVCIEAIGPEQSRVLFEAVLEREGQELS